MLYYLCAPSPTLDLPDMAAAPYEKGRKIHKCSSPTNRRCLVPMLQLHGLTERLSLVCGAVLVLVIGPPVGAVVGSTVLWEAIDRGFAGGLVESGKELSGLIFARLIPVLERLTKPYARPRLARSRTLVLPTHPPRSVSACAVSTSGW